MPSLVILGAGGFVGRTLLDSEAIGMPVKAVARSIPAEADSADHSVTWFAADLLTPMSVLPILSSGDVVINLAHSAKGDEAEALHLIDNVVDACLHSKVARLVHCSTATVAGRASSSRVVESTPCVPRTRYERTKWAAEQRVVAALAKGLDVGVLRPTAIVGPGGRNLVTLATALQEGSPFVNYVRASCFGRRAMHLVPERTVAEALLHLAFLPAALNGSVYLVSSDDDPENNFQDVERALMLALGLKPRTIPLLPVPARLLSVLLWMLGRSDTDGARTYDSAKLLETNFTPVRSLSDAVREFGHSNPASEKRHRTPMTSLQQNGPGLTSTARARADRNVGRRYLFNFAVSAVGGGLKRLQEYARWFDANGGAGFVIHPSCDELATQFPHNAYFVVSQPKFQRLYADCKYLDGICRQVGAPDLYYAYGIPIYKRIGRVNWFHLSNVLPLESRQIPLPTRQKLSARYLGWRIRSHYHYADVISAESRFSLGLIDVAEPDRLCLSVNGSDDEINRLKCASTHDMENVAIVVGTNRHKALDESFRVFEMLRTQNPALKLVIIGDERRIPPSVLRQHGVSATGVLERGEVIRRLMRSKYYISTTLIENSYNAASEGIVFAGESYISDIGPHRELLADVPVEIVAVPHVSGHMLHVRRDCIGSLQLKSWDEVIGEMLNRVAVRPSRIP